MKKDSSKYIFILLLSCLAFMFIDNVSAESYTNLGGDITWQAAHSTLFACSVTGTNCAWGQGATSSGKSTLNIPRNYLLDTVELTMRVKPNQWVVGAKYVLVWYIETNQAGFLRADDYNCSTLNGSQAWASSSCTVENTNFGLVINAEFVSSTSNSDVFLVLNTKYKIDPTFLHDMGDVPMPWISAVTTTQTSVNTLKSIMISVYDDGTQSIVDSNNQINSSINNVDSTLNGIKDLDIPDSSKELPDDSSFNNYEDAEGALVDKIQDADLSAIDIGIGVESSSFIWDTITRSIQTHPKVFGMFISILSIGIIKLALGR